MKSSIVVLAALTACSAPPVLSATINGCPIRPATLCVEYDLRAAQLRNADLARADLSQSDLSGADLGGARLVSADLDMTKLNRANLSGANLEGADLTRAEMYGANLRRAQLKGANLHSADLNGAILDGAQLQGTNLSGAHLPGAGLRDAHLARADLSGALLSYADLRGADLTGANLRNATLTGADLTGARLTGAIFDGADSRGCIGCPDTPGATPRAASAATTRARANGNAVLRPATSKPDTAFGNGCWARIYTEENFRGEALTVTGPAEIADLRSDFGFAWDPRYNSIMVGPRAMLTLYDDRHFRDRTAVFRGGEELPDLDERMGIFRTIGSVRVTCAR